MRRSLEINRPVMLSYSSLCGIGRYCTGVYSETVSQMVLCWEFAARQCHKWYSAGVDSETVSQMVLCWGLQWDSITNGTMLGFTVRQCHRCTVMGIYTETLSQMVLCWGLSLKQCQIVPCSQYTEAVSQMAPYCGFSWDIATNIQYVCWSVRHFLLVLRIFWIFKYFAAFFIVFIALLAFWVVIPSDAVDRYQCNGQLLSWACRWPENDTVDSFESSVKNYQK